MWSRSDLKEKAKIAFKANYWKCVIVSLILGLTTGGSYSAVSGRVSGSPNSYVDSSVLAALGVLSVIALILKIFVFNPMNVGGNTFFRKNALYETEISEVVEPFRTNYINAVFTMFLRDVFLFLWAMLLVVPGIIKAYSYRMVPYILGENPDMDARDAITLSRQMMDGNKWDTFLLDLSFIGWLILTVMTLGILGIFFVSPYIYQTDAELYLVLKDDDPVSISDGYYGTDQTGYSDSDYIYPMD